MATARFEFRIQSEAKRRIEAAAALASESASDFARAATLARADEILKRQEHTLVPSDYFDDLMRELDKPPVRNERLAQAAKRAQDFLVYGD
ncbi:DUF1778 domain-containing protein [Amycolatopsis sp. NPDC058278]|uniref:type II toxin -antitoxin system TacA 1-like antitoxin n=1 Tax=Amycolatopsis sp. NPDC058278 TaxID=3346417 RepID=UPI0036DD9774